MRNQVSTRELPSGVPGLDEVLGGGIPNASPERKALFFSVIGEPPLKMLRYMQQHSFGGRRAHAPTTWMCRTSRNASRPT